MPRGNDVLGALGSGLLGLSQGLQVTSQMKRQKEQDRLNQMQVLAALEAQRAQTQMAQEQLVQLIEERKRMEEPVGEQYRPLLPQNYQSGIQVTGGRIPMLPTQVPEMPLRRDLPMMLQLAGEQRARALTQSQLSSEEQRRDVGAEELAAVRANQGFLAQHGGSEMAYQDEWKRRNFELEKTRVNAQIANLMNENKDRASAQYVDFTRNLWLPEFEQAVALASPPELDAAETLISQGGRPPEGTDLRALRMMRDADAGHITIIKTLPSMLAKLGPDETISFIASRLADPQATQADPALFQQVFDEVGRQIPNGDEALRQIMQKEVYQVPNQETTTTNQGRSVNVGTQGASPVETPGAAADVLSQAGPDFQMPSWRESSLRSRLGTLRPEEQTLGPPPVDPDTLLQLFSLARGEDIPPELESLMQVRDTGRRVPQTSNVRAYAGARQRRYR